MSVNVKLPPALETFVRERVESGEYETASDVLLDGVRALERRHSARASFTRTLIAAEEEAERDGWIPFDDVLAEMDLVVEEAEHAASRR
jgi:putative addiction module CopG family antidote